MSLDQWRISFDVGIVEDANTLISNLALWSDKHPVDKSDDI